MRLLNLFEMPVRDIQTTQIDDPRSSFPDKRDWAMVSKDSFQKRIRNAFDNSPYTFNLYFYNIPYTNEMVHIMGMDDIYDSGIDDKYRYKIENDLKITLPQPISDEISVAMMHHTGASHRLTPWILAHRIAHGQRLFDKDVRELWKKYNSVPMLNGNTRNLFPVFHMNSVKTDQIPVLGELSHEILTEYILTGSIRVGPQSEEDRAAIGDSLSQSWKRHLDYAGLKQELEELCKYTLDSLVGKLILAD